MTIHPGYFLRKLCAGIPHFAISHGEHIGRIRFSFGWCRMDADANALAIKACVGEPAQLKQVADLLVRRLKKIIRGAARELVWLC